MPSDHCSKNVTQLGYVFKLTVVQLYTNYL